MGNPAVYYYANGVFGVLTAIDFAENITALDERFDLFATESETVGGVHDGTILRARMGITLQKERFTSASLYRSLFNLQNHMARFGSMAFCRDTAKAWAGYTLAGHAAGTRTLETNGNTWAYGSQNDTATLAAGDEVIVSAPNPDGRYEIASVSSVSGNAITIASPGLIYDYSDVEWLFVRHRDYYPSLRLAPGSSRDLLSTERRLAHTFSADLVEDVNAIAVMSGSLPGVLRDTSDSMTQATIDALVRADINNYSRI